MLNVAAKELLRVVQPKVAIDPKFRLSEHIKIVDSESSNGHTVAEFIGTDSFPHEFNERRRYEILAGRDLEPLLYTSIYSEINDPGLPEFVPVFQLGPGGVVFDEVTEGGEVHFVTVGAAQFSVQIKHYGAGVEYTKDLVIFNRVWQLSIIERRAGVAYNALRNHIHLSPIITATYPAGNLTPASASGSTLEEKFVRTLEAAITTGTDDNVNRRTGPYVLLCATGDRYMIERALTRVPQQGTMIQSTAIDTVQTLIAYNGWSGSRGKKVTSYAGVPTGTCFLISINDQDEDFQSFVKQDLEDTAGNPDVSRFILEQQVLDAYLGVYANPIRSVQKITLPT